MTLMLKPMVIWITVFVKIAVTYIVIDQPTDASVFNSVLDVRVFSLQKCNSRKNTSVINNMNNQ